MLHIHMFLLKATAGSHGQNEVGMGYLGIRLGCIVRLWL